VDFIVAKARILVVAAAVGGVIGVIAPVGFVVLAGVREDIYWHDRSDHEEMRSVGFSWQAWGLSTMVRSADARFLPRDAAELAGDESIAVDLVRSGWPLTAVWRARLHRPKPPAPGTITLHPDWSMNGEILADAGAYRVAWIGLVVDTIVYSGLAVGVALALMWVLRRIGEGRARRALGRGVCPGCGYPVVAGGCCPECGREFG